MHLSHLVECIVAKIAIVIWYKTFNQKGYRSWQVVFDF